MSKPVMHPELVASILAFCEAEGISKAKFGLDHMGDPKFVYDLEQGRECRMATVRKVEQIVAPMEGTARGAA